MRHPLERDDTSLYTPSDIIHIACFYLDVNPNTLLKKGRTKELVICRMLIYDLLIHNKRLQLTFQKIGNLFGRHHSSIINSRDELRNYLDVYDEIRQRLEHLHLSVYRHLDYYNHPLSVKKKDKEVFKKILIDLPEQMFYDMLKESRKTDITLSDIVQKCVHYSLGRLSNS